MKRHFKQVTALENCLAKQALDCRERAETLPPGKERDTLLMRARQADTAAQIEEWINSPGLQPPE